VLGSRGWCRWWRLCLSGLVIRSFWLRLLRGGGAQVVGLGEALSFDGVRDTLEAVAGQLAMVWQKVQPAEATVELGFSLSTKTGKLTALLVEGSGEASLKVARGSRRIAKPSCLRG
jgi:hypothetical protein